MTNYPKPPFQTPRQQMPGSTNAMSPAPDHGEDTYRGSGRLAGKKAVITGGDSGIGRAVAIAYAREGADVLISYLDEDSDAEQTNPGSKRLAARPSSCPATSRTRSTAGVSSTRR